jgi:hypothetical protein
MNIRRRSHRYRIEKVLNIELKGNKTPKRKTTMKMVSTGSERRRTVGNKNMGRC